MQHSRALAARVLDFVAAFVDIELLPSVIGTWRKLEASRRAAFQLPWSHAVLRVIELESYGAQRAHRPGFMAAELGISLAEERECVEALVGSGQLQWDGARYRVNEVRLTDTRHNPEAGRTLEIWWAKRALERLEQERELIRTTSSRSRSEIISAFGSCTSTTFESSAASFRNQSPHSAWSSRIFSSCHSPAARPRRPPGPARLRQKKSSARAAKAPRKGPDATPGVRARHR
jgi:hypothetical protein